MTSTSAYQPGLWRRLKNGTTFVPEYLHSDSLGTLRVTTGTTGAASGSDVFTAFGERQGGNPDRFGFVGAWGYQSTPIPESPNPDTAFPFLHVGARYYDPSSGRFLQRDPIGIDGGLNVYLYGRGQPTNLLDPGGLWSWPGFAGGVGVGTGARAPGLTKIPAAIVGALICGIAGGLEKDDPSRLWDEVKEAVDDYIDRGQPKPPQRPRPPAGCCCSGPSGPLGVQ